jgi:hypothetical protein
LSVPALIAVQRVQSLILLIRGQKVILDSDLAGLYGVETRVLIQAVKRNRVRFPDDFTFQLTGEDSRTPFLQRFTNGDLACPASDAFL